MADPAGTLKQEGIEIPAGMMIKVVENTGRVLHVVIPERPTELSDEDLTNVGGGGDPCDGVCNYVCQCKCGGH